MSEPQTFLFDFYSGTNPDPQDPSETRSFVCKAEFEAWRRGTQAADGWFDARFLDHGFYRVDKDGEVRQTLRKPGNASGGGDCILYILWGEHPDPGSEPEIYHFDSAGEAAAFRRGVEDGVGAGRLWLVPDGGFKPAPGTEEARALLSGDGLQSFTRWEEGGGEVASGTDYVFVRADGAIVGDEWEPGQPIYNTPAPAVARRHKPGA